MSLSWNLPSWPKQSWKVCNPSRQPSWGTSTLSCNWAVNFFFDMQLFFSLKLFASCFHQFLNKKISHFWRRKVSFNTEKTRVNKMQRKRILSGKKCLFCDFRAEIRFLSWTEMVTSWARPNWKSFSSARTHHF